MKDLEIQELQRKILNLEMEVMKNRQISKPSIDQARELVTLRRKLHKATKSNY